MKRNKEIKIKTSEIRDALNNLVEQRMKEAKDYSRQIENEVKDITDDKEIKIEKISNLSHLFG